MNLILQHNNNITMYATACSNTRIWNLLNRKLLLHAMTCRKVILLYILLHARACKNIQNLYNKKVVLHAIVCSNILAWSNVIYYIYYCMPLHAILNNAWFWKVWKVTKWYTNDLKRLKNLILVPTASFYTKVFACVPIAETMSLNIGIYFAVAPSIPKKTTSFLGCYRCYIGDDSGTIC